MRHQETGSRMISKAIETLESRQLLAAATPFPMETPEVPAETVLFANFDNGGEGVAYHDTDRRNRGGEYRRRERVDIERVQDAPAEDVGEAPGQSRGIGHVRAGEWLQYGVDVTTGGQYRFELRYAAGRSGGGTAHVEVDGEDVTGTIDLNSTGGWQQWKTLQKSGITLAEGRHAVRFVIDGGDGDISNLHWFRFAAEGSANPSNDNASAQEDLSWPSTWTQIEDAPSPRFEAMTHSFRDRLYVFGGFKNSDFDVDRTYARFNPDTGEWETLGNLPRGMAETHAMPVDDGRFIYFVGGFGGDLRHGEDPTQAASDATWRYDPKRDRWARLPSLPILQGAGGTAIAKGKLHVISGNTEDRVENISNHYVLDLSDISGGWSTAPAMPDPKDHFSTVTLNGKIYTIGGEYDHDVAFNTQTSVHVYEPNKKRWRQLADIPMPVGHAEGSTFIRDGRIIFAGGQTKDQAASDRVFSYDPQGDEWSELGRLPMPLQGASVSMFDDQVFVTLGGRYTVQPLATTYVGSL